VFKCGEKNDKHAPRIEALFFPEPLVEGFAHLRFGLLKERKDEKTQLV
jgi:hypothetical protein